MSLDSCHAHHVHFFNRALRARCNTTQLYLFTSVRMRLRLREPLRLCMHMLAHNRGVQAAPKPGFVARLGLLPRLELLLQLGDLAHAPCELTYVCVGKVTGCYSGNEFKMVKVWDLPWAI